MSKKRLLSLALVAMMLVTVFTGCLGSDGGSSSPSAGDSGGASESDGNVSDSGGAAPAADGIVIRMGTSTQTSMPACAAAERFATLIGERTDGRITIDFFPARQIGDDTELMEQVMTGTLETALVSSSTFSAYTPLLDTLQVPFLLSSYEKEYAALTSPEAQALYEGMEPLGFKTLAVYEYGIRHLANNQRPIETPADLNGLMIRVVPSNLILDSINALGGNPTPMAYGEVYTALQTKVVDGVEINYTSIASEKYYEVLSYVSDISLWPFPGALVVNMDFWGTLSEEDQAIFQQTALECLDYNMELLEEAEAAARELIAENGGQMNQIGDIAPFVEATAEVRANFAAQDERIAAFIGMAEQLD